MKTKCDLCSKDLITIYYDAKTKMGPWGNLCPECFKEVGIGLGTGLGQMYHKLDEMDLPSTSGTWTKVEG